MKMYNVIAGSRVRKLLLNIFYMNNHNTPCIYLAVYCIAYNEYLNDIVLGIIFYKHCTFVCK